LLVPPKLAQDMQANLHEVLPIWENAYGQRKARWAYRTEVFRLVIGHWGNNILKLAERVMKMLPLSSG